MCDGQRVGIHECDTVAAPYSSILYTAHGCTVARAAVCSVVCIASPEMLIMQCTKRMRVLLYSAYFLNQEVLYYTIL